jgi:hypothetical protein
MCGALRAAFRTDALARSYEPQDNFLTVRTELQEFYAARDQKDYLFYRIALEEERLSPRQLAFLSRCHDGCTVFRGDF